MQARVKICHVITRLIVGGAQENTVLTCRLLDRAEFDPFLVCGVEAGSEGSLLEEARAAGIRTRLVPELVREVRPASDVAAAIHLSRLFRQEAPHIVHTHSSKAGIVGRAAAWMRRVPIIIHTVHGWGFGEHTASPAQALYVMLERAMARISDALVAVAQQDIRKGLSAGIGRIGQYELVRSGIEIEAFKNGCADPAAKRRELGLPVEAPVIGTVGRLSPQKDPLTFVEAAAAVAAQLPEARFLMVGDGPLRSAVEVRAAERGLRDRLLVLGLRRDVPEILPILDVFVLASRWEGLPRTLPQAMSAGVPVIATRVDGVEDVVVDGVTGLLTSPGDPLGLARGILKLVRDPELSSRVAGHAKIRVEEFRVERMVLSLEALYRRLLLAKGIFASQTARR